MQPQQPQPGEPLPPQPQSPYQPPYQPQYPPQYQPPTPQQYQEYGQRPLSPVEGQEPPVMPPTNGKHQEKLHPMVVLQPGERVIGTLKRHPFGILSLYFSGMIAILIAALLVFVLLPKLADQYNLADYNGLIFGGLGLLGVILVLILTVATVIYWQNEWIITTDSITQILQTSLFTRQVSQLSLDNLEDVTVDQDGIIPHMFNFGTLKVETAGERSKFQFAYCPNPNEYARRILEVHEQFLEERRNIMNRP